MTYDVRLTDDGDLPALTEHITGPEAIAQRVRIRLRTFLGEWFLDTRRGLPFFQWKQARPADIDAIEARIRREVRQTPGVLRVEDLSASITDGALSITGSVIVEDRALRLQAEALGPGGNAQPVTVLLV